MLEKFGQAIATAIAKVPGAVTVATEIAESAPGAKPLWRSMSLNGATVMAITWAIHNLAVWWVLDESTESLMVFAAIGALSYATVVVATLRRNDIKVPNWIVAAAALVAASAP